MSRSFESVRWTARVRRLDHGLYSHPKDFGGEWSQNPCYLQGKNPYQMLRGGSNLRHCIKQDSEPNTVLTELFWPRTVSGAGIHIART